MTRLLDGEHACLEWQAATDGLAVDDGADGFVIRDGLVWAQTIHYSVRHRTGCRGRLSHAGGAVGSP